MKEKKPRRFQMRPFKELGCYLCRFPDSALVWTAPMFIDGSMDWPQLGTVEFDNIDDGDAARILEAVDRVFPRARRCFGAETADGSPDCEGFPVHHYRVRADDGRTFETVYCGDCAAMAPSENLTLTLLA